LNKVDEMYVNVENF